MDMWEQAWVHPNQLPASFETQQSFHPIGHMHTGWCHRYPWWGLQSEQQSHDLEKTLDDILVWFELRSNPAWWLSQLISFFFSFFWIWWLMWTDLDVSKGLKFSALVLAFPMMEVESHDQIHQNPQLECCDSPITRGLGALEKSARKKQPCLNKQAKNMEKSPTSVSSDIFCLTALGARTKSLFSDQPHGAKLWSKRWCLPKLPHWGPKLTAALGWRPSKIRSPPSSSPWWLDFIVSSMASWHLGKVAKTSWFSFIRPSISINCQCFQCLQLKAPFCHTHHWHLWRSVQHPAARGTGHEGKKCFKRTEHLPTAMSLVGHIFQMKNLSCTHIQQL